MGNGNDQLAQLRTDLSELLERTDVGSRREFGRALGWKTGEEMIRLFLEGKTEIALDKAAEWAARCEAVLRAVPKRDPLAAVDLAVGALPDQRYRQLKRHLRAILRDEISSADEHRPKAGAAGASR